MLANNGRHIGQIAKLHGIRGEVVLVSEALLPKDILKTEWVFLMIDGLPVPFHVLEISLRNETSAIISFEGYSTPEESEVLIGNPVFIEQRRNKKTQAAENVDNIKGYNVIDRLRGPIGKASEVINYQGNFVLQVWYNEIEILIPVDESIILGIEDEKKEIYISAPDGLLDLYL